MGTEGEYDQKSSLPKEPRKEGKGEKGIVALTHDWDSNGEFALFKYSLVSRECSHPELAILHYIAEEDKYEFEGDEDGSEEDNEE